MKKKYDGYINIMSLGSYPLNVNSFIDSEDFFENLIYIDFKIHNFNESELDDFRQNKVKHSLDPVKTQEIEFLIKTITCQYKMKKNQIQMKENKLHYLILIANLNSLINNEKEITKIFKHNNENYNFFKKNQDNSKYNNILMIRYFFFYGLTLEESKRFSYWRYNIECVLSSDQLNEIVINFWLDKMFYNFGTYLRKKNNREICFDLDIKKSIFIKDDLLFIRLSGFFIREENVFLVNDNYILNFISFLEKKIKDILESKIQFPDADSLNRDLEIFVKNLYNILDYAPTNQQILDLDLSSQFLIFCMQKTFHSRIVLKNYVTLLIDKKKLDEAFMAFKCYVLYLNKEEEENIDILSSIELYSNYILNFNLLNLQFKENKELINIDDEIIIESLDTYSSQLIKYLNDLKEYAGISYFNSEFDDLSESSHKKNLSFFYFNYNKTFCLMKKSNISKLISFAWFSLGYYYYYLSRFRSPTNEIVLHNVKETLTCYKKSLIINSSSNYACLFNYALILAYKGYLSSSLKVCQHILRNEFECFKTWNLFILILTSIERCKFDKSKDENFEISDKESYDNKSKTLKEYIDYALSIAYNFILKHSEKKIEILNEKKYELIQLKITQLSVEEFLYGIDSVSVKITELFSLYNDLFLNQVLLENNDHNSKDILELRDTAVKNDLNNLISTLTETDSKKPEKNNSFKKKLFFVSRFKQISSFSSKVNSSSIQKKIKKSHDNFSKKLLQYIWIWTGMFYLKQGLYEDAEQCIIESESIYKPNTMTFIFLGYLTSNARKNLSMNEFQKAINLLKYDNCKTFDYINSLLGLSKLFIVDDCDNKSLFISEDDYHAALAMLKVSLEEVSKIWPIGYNNVEIWYYLSKIYEIYNNKHLLIKSLWKCIKLEDYRPVRPFEICDYSIIYIK